MILKIAELAKEEFLKAKIELQKQVQKGKEKVQLKPLGEKIQKSSFFSKALQWTKDLAAEITEELEKTNSESIEEEVKVEEKIEEVVKEEEKKEKKEETIENKVNTLLEEEEAITVDDLQVLSIFNLTEIRQIESISLYQLQEIVTSTGIDGKVCLL